MSIHYQGAQDEKRVLDAYVKLMRAADSLSKRLEKYLSRFNLTENQFGILEMLLHLGPLFQREIGDKLFVSGANVTLLVDQLETRGWVRRERSAGDRRQVQIHLTEQGHREISAIFPKYLTALMDEFSVLSPQEQEALARMCKKIGLHT